MRIDSHQHFWQYDAVEFDWISEEMSAIRRDFLPGDLAAEFERNGLDGSVAVQARQSADETHWLLGLANENPMIKAVVGWIDLCADDLEAQLSEYKGQAKLKGFRHVIQGEPDGYMLQPNFIRGVTLLADYGYSFDILILSRQLAEACELVKKLPVMKLVVDHIAKPDIAGMQWEGWHESMTELALHEHVYCKLSGMVTEADWHNWKQADFQQYMQHVLTKFGSDRTMFGSDWPVCKVAGSYQDVLSLVEIHLQGFSEKDAENVLGNTASTFYRLS
jgi:L-fuconolactonase